MAHLIDKDALVAEIERRLWLLVPKMTFHQQRVELEKLLSFINTLEVKEVDLEKEINEHWDEWAKEDGFHSIDFAKHFFELGLNVADVDSVFDRKSTEDIFTVLTKGGKIKKKAVNGIVTTNIDGWVDVMTGFIRPEEAGVNFGDKVKLIIIKEE